MEQLGIRLLAKLGAIAVHAEEYLSPDGHSVDKTALENLLADEEVQTWLKSMGALVPKKRKQPVKDYVNSAHNWIVKL